MQDHTYAVSRDQERSAIPGTPDFNGNQRGSWDTLREEYAPALIDSFSLSAAKDDQRIATSALHTRGPIKADMPVYVTGDSITNVVPCIAMVRGD